MEKEGAACRHCRFTKKAACSFTPSAYRSSSSATQRSTEKEGRTSRKATRKAEADDGEEGATKRLKTAHVWLQDFKGTTAKRTPQKKVSSDLPAIETLARESSDDGVEIIESD